MNFARLYIEIMRPPHFWGPVCGVTLKYSTKWPYLPFSVVALYEDNPKEIHPTKSFRKGVQTCDILVKCVIDIKQKLSDDKRGN